MTKPWHAPLRGWIALLVALLAVPVGALFVCGGGHDHSALPLFVWQITTALALLGLVRLPRFRARPSVPAGLAGLLAWMALAPVFARAIDERMSSLATLSVVLVYLASGLGTSAIAAAIAERATVMRSTVLPGRGLAILTLALALASAVAVLSVRAIGARPRQITGNVVGWIELPALATVVRERFGGVELEAVTEPQPGGGSTARVSLSSSGRSPGPTLGSAAPCVVEVPPGGRTIELVAHADAYVVHWPESPHGEVFGGCTFDRTTLALLPREEVARHAPVELTWSLAAAAGFGVLVLLASGRIRRRHGRIARSPEVQVTAPGIATMPDGTPAMWKI